MSVEDNVKDLIDDMKVRKEAWVKEHPDDPDMPTLICVYRDGELVAQALSLPDRDVMLKLANVFAYGCVAQEITMTFESFHSNLEKNPITEERWGEGEMSFIAREHNGIKLGWVTEDTSLMAYDREGNHLMATLTFEIDGDQVVWGEEKLFIADQAKEDQRVDGYVHESMINIMQSGTMEDAAKEDLGEEGFKLLIENLGEDRLIHSDLATVKFVLKQGLAVAAGLMARPGSERAKRIPDLLKQSLENDDGFKVHHDSTGI